MPEIKNGVIVEEGLGLAPKISSMLSAMRLFGSGGSANSTKFLQIQSKAAIGHDDSHRVGAPGLAAISSSS